MKKTYTASKNRYNAKTYDFINLTVPKGQKEIIKSYAKNQGKSTNEFIREAIQQIINKCNNSAPPVP